MRTTEQALKKARWTRYITRRVNRMREQLEIELGETPKGRKFILLQAILEKYGVLLILSRELRKREELVKDDGSLVSLLSAHHLAWLHSLERSLVSLFGEKGFGDQLPDNFSAIDERFRSKKNE